MRVGVLSRKVPVQAPICGAIQALIAIGFFPGEALDGSLSRRRPVSFEKLIEILLQSGFWTSLAQLLELFAGTRHYPQPKRPQIASTGHVNTPTEWFLSRFLKGAT